MMINEKMDDMMMVFNDCYPVEAYKKHYLTARTFPLPPAKTAPHERTSRI